MTCSVFVMTVISFFPNGATETEGEDDSQELNRYDNNNGSNDNVEIVFYQHDKLVVTTSVHERVILGGISDALWFLRLYKSLVTNEKTARLGNLKIFSRSEEIDIYNQM